MPMSKNLDKWIPDPVTRETRQFHLCDRCGRTLETPSIGEPIMCRDCYDVTHPAPIPRTREEAIEQIEQGETYRTVADRMGLSKSCIYKWHRKARMVAA